MPPVVGTKCGSTEACICAPQRCLTHCSLSWAGPSSATAGGTRWYSSEGQTSDCSSVTAARPKDGVLPACLFILFIYCNISYHNRNHHQQGHSYSRAGEWAPPSRDGRPARARQPGALPLQRPGTQARCCCPGPGWPAASRAFPSCPHVTKPHRRTGFFVCR